MLTEDLIKLYLKEQNAILKQFPIKEVIQLCEKIKWVHEVWGRVFVFGNGGGADIASHFATDLGIHPFVSEDKKSSKYLHRLWVHCLNDSSGMLTRLGNDMGLDCIFKEQLKQYHLDCRDLVLAFSTSGNSSNIIDALYYALSYETTTALIGGRGGGGAKEYANICILIPGTSSFPGQIGANDNCFHIEDFQQVIAHIITGIIKEEVSGEIT